MLLRLRAGLLVAGLALPLAACGSDKVSDINSATAQQCKTELSALLGQATSAGAPPALSEDNAPAACKKVEDATGRQILTEITEELSAKARSQLAGAASSQGALGGSAGAGSAGVELSAGASAAGGGSANAGASAAGAGTTKPSALPVGNSEWRLEKVNLKASSLGFFGGTYAIRYIGPEQSILSVTTPSEIGVYRGGKKVATMLVNVGAPGPNEVTTLTVVSEDKFAQGPYTFSLRFE